MHETVTGAGQQLSLFTLRLPLFALCFTLLSQKKKHLEDCVALMLGELKVEETALQKKELSLCFAYIILLKQICVCSTTADKDSLYTGLKQ